MWNSFMKLAERAICKYSIKFMHMMCKYDANAGAIWSECKSIIHIMKVASECYSSPGALCNDYTGKSDQMLLMSMRFRKHSISNFICSYSSHQSMIHLLSKSQGAIRSIALHHDDPLQNMEKGRFNFHSLPIEPLREMLKLKLKLQSKFKFEIRNESLGVWARRHWAQSYKNSSKCRRSLSPRERHFGLRFVEYQLVRMNKNTFGVK